ncbi:hypothetical protein MMYC01_205166 [Madurella mycetomatis]|uniref:Infection structure specific protein n=1 Tax=Madurella mycetomatis TaxID=100816 RepID=A0A175W3F9_9PEZI|nr:hypothetical protein MMYC01_205166 [Madurella mycetomatis]
MISQSLLLAALAATAAATGPMNLHPAHQAVKRFVEARQTDGSEACTAALMSIATDMPTPPSEIMSFAMTATETDPCSITLPPNVESAISSYAQEAQSWFSENESEFSSVMEDCPDVASIYSSASAALESAALPTCDGGSGNNGGSDSGSSNDDNNDDSNNNGDDNTGGDDNEGGNDNSNSNDSGNEDDESAGARPTGFVGAAIAVAGFLGVVAVL